MLKIAFVGFRHGHIMGLYNTCKSDSRVKLVAACEEDPATIDALKSAGKVQLTHTSFADMLKSVDCDAIAVGDYFANRGFLIIQSLKARKHIISDKPVCTSLDELDQIAQLARSTNRKIGCLLDLRDSGVFITARKLVRDGTIGEVLTANFTAQHPLLLATRPRWYFEPNKHGGTINDIGVHGIDLLPWLTGRTFAQCVAARTWNVRVPQAPHFQEGGQFMLKLDNDAGVLGDVSYFTPDGIAYAAPQYWRITIHGTQGLIEASFSQRTLTLTTAEDKSPRAVDLEPDHPTGCLDAFLREIAGSSNEPDLMTNDVLRASRTSLVIQQAADQNRTNVPLA